MGNTHCPSVTGRHKKVTSQPIEEEATITPVKGSLDKDVC